MEISRLNCRRENKNPEENNMQEQELTLTQEWDKTASKNHFRYC